MGCLHQISFEFPTLTWLCNPQILEATVVPVQCYPLTKRSGLIAHTLVNEGPLHAVWCEWCGIKMGCSCWDGNNPERQGHIIVLCPRCQVTDFLNLLFRGHLLRDEVLSKSAARMPPIKGPSKPRSTPELRIMTGGKTSG